MTMNIENETEYCWKIHAEKTKLYDISLNQLGEYNTMLYNINERKNICEVELRSFEYSQQDLCEKVSVFNIAAITYELKNKINNYNSEIEEYNRLINLCELDIERLNLEFNALEIYITELNKRSVRLERWPNITYD
jgi:predicted  nucleic acid-binding Zn-ribbon protein